MSELKAWWGVLGGRQVLLVARSRPDAAKLAGIKVADLPFRFEQTRRPHNADKAGVYREVGTAWIREQAAKGPPDLEEP